MDNLLPISALQHYAYCPRQFALIHTEQAWEENRFTAEGRVLHKRVDSGEVEKRGNIRSERSVMLRSEYYQLIGKMDLVEISEADPSIYYPVEYKRGKPKVENWDRIQLCAQAICLEEMRGVSISEGAIWYWEEHKRQTIFFDEGLREETKSVISKSRALLDNGVTPPPISDSRRCRACSLRDLCQPKKFLNDRSEGYIQTMYDL